MSSYDKVANILMNAPDNTVSLKFEDVQGLLREFRQRQFALEAALLFHDEEAWTGEKWEKWSRITKSDKATHTILCDHIRKVLER